MYPHEELIRLAANKVTLRRNIAARREQCVRAAVAVERPLEYLDRAVAFIRRLSPLAPFAALPLGFLVRRVLISRSKFLGSLATWVPLAASVLRGIGSVTLPNRRAPPPGKPVRRAP